MGFYAFGTRFQLRFFARKDISWRVRKPNAKQNRFQIVTIFFFTFSSAYFLDEHVTYVPSGFGKVLLVMILGCHGRIQRGDRGSGPPPPPHEKSQKFRVSKQHWSISPEKSQNYQASIQCWAIIGPPAKRHLMLGHYRPASETPFKWRFTGGPMMACLLLYVDPPSPHQLKKRSKSKLDLL